MSIYEFHNFSNLKYSSHLIFFSFVRVCVCVVRFTNLTNIKSFRLSSNILAGTMDAKSKVKRKYIEWNSIYIRYKELGDKSKVNTIK